MFQPTDLPNLEVYLDSLIWGPAGPPYNGGDGGFQIWPDMSGHDASHNLYSQVPNFLLSYISNPNGPYSPQLSANGSPAIWFWGGNYGGAQVAFPMPDASNGYTVLAYGRFHPAQNQFHSSVLWQNTTGTGPQCGYEDTDGQRWFFRDNFGTYYGDPFGTQARYGLMGFRFSPPNDGTGLGEAFFQCPTDPAPVRHLCHPWQETDTPGCLGYILGANQGGNCIIDADMCAHCFYSRALSDDEISELFAGFVNRFG